MIIGRWIIIGRMIVRPYLWDSFHALRGVDKTSYGTGRNHWYIENCNAMTSLSGDVPTIAHCAP